MADKKITQLNTLSAPIATDIIAVVDDPGGTPETKKATIGDIIGISSPPQGRLTLTTGVPVMVASATAQTTIYYTPAVGNRVPVYDGTVWSMSVFTELSQATTDNTKSPAAVGNNSNYDLFVWNDAGTLRCTRGPAWSSDTSRGTGAGTTELERVAGLLLNKVSITNGPAAQRGTYVGTVRSNGSAQIDMIFGGTGAAGGESTIVGVWNAYNRVITQFINHDNTDSWTYTTSTLRIKNNSNANKISFVIGWEQDGLSALNSQHSSNSTANIAAIIATALDSTTTVAGNSPQAVSRSPSSNATFNMVCPFNVLAPLGFHYLAPLERSTATGTATWYGDAGGGSGSASNVSAFTMTLPW